MSSTQRFKTAYEGVCYRLARKKGEPKKTEKVFYVHFYKNGKKVEEKVGFESDGVTAARANAYRVERMQGRKLSRKEIKLEKIREAEEFANRITIDQLWQQYQQANPNRNWSSDISWYNRYLHDDYATKAPSEILTADIEKTSSFLHSEGKAPQTIKHILGLLRRIINFGIKRGVCPSIDKSRLYFEMPRVDNEKTEMLTPEQLQRYLDVLDAEPDQNAAAFLRLALVTGMRKGAIIGLRWEDIDFNNGFITLRGEIAKNGKTEKIPLTDAARAVLQRITRTDSDYVFPGRDGGKRENFVRVARRVRNKAGLPKDFRPLHGLRHAYASMLASSGKVDIYTLQKLMTHGSPQMTQRYAHLADDALKRAASVINEALPFDTSQQ